MPARPEPETFCPSSRQHWREWLQAHHASRSAVWLLYHKQSSPTANLSYAEAVEEALCFGWIDSRAQPVDAHTYRQFFSPRKPGSTWSRVNKERVQRLQAAGQLTPAGLAAIALAQHNGTWTLLDEVEALVPPPDLQQALAAAPGRANCFAALSRSVRRELLLRLLLAKRPETRQQRIGEIVARLDARP